MPEWKASKTSLHRHRGRYASESGNAPQPPFAAPRVAPKRRPLRRTDPRQGTHEEAEQRAYLDVSLNLGLQLLEVLHDRPVDSATEVRVLVCDGTRLVADAIEDILRSSARTSLEPA